MALCKYNLKDKMLIGKYKHHTIQDAIDINPSYVDWLRVHAKNNFEIDEITEAYLVDRLVLFAISNMNKHLNNKNIKYKKK